MIQRILLSVAAVILAAVTLSACGHHLGAGPFGNNDAIPGTQCVPVSAGVDVHYNVNGQTYLIPFQTALVLVAGSRCPA